MQEQEMRSMLLRHHHHVAKAANANFLACAGDMVLGMVDHKCIQYVLQALLRNCMWLTVVCFLLSTGAQVQSQPPVQGLVPYGDDD